MSIARQVASCGVWLLVAGGAVLLAGCSGAGGGQPSPSAASPAASASASNGASASIPGVLPPSAPSSAVAPATTVAPPATPAASPAGGLNYYRYKNKRFGFSLDVPDGFKAGQPPVDGDGQEFDSANGAASVTGWGVNNIGASPGTSLVSPAKDLADLVSTYQSHGDTVTYKTVDGDIIAVSGTTPQGKIFYERHVVYSQAVYALVWSYPASQKAQFDAIINHTVATFTPGPNQGA